MSSSFKFSHIFQVYTCDNLIENLGRIERIGESMCTCEVLLEKCKNCRQEIICSNPLAKKSWPILVQYWTKIKILDQY
jgi:hypothetical protein